MARTFPGALAGVVRDNEDPTGSGRVKAYVPAIGEPYVTKWLQPMGWPGAGAPDFGSQYPIPLDANIMVLFEQGDPTAGGWYAPSGYGHDSKGYRGPSRNDELRIAYGARAAVRCSTLHEDANLRIFVDYQDVGEDDDKRRLVVEDKKRGSLIVFDVAAGSNKNSVDISLYSATSMSLTADGNIDISARNVQIQGRRVLRGGKKTI